MENHRIPPLTWPYYCHGKGVEELRRSLLCTTLELETTRLAAQEEIRRRDEEVKQLKDLLNRAIRERDDANDKYQRLLLQLQQQQQLQQEGQGLSSSECEESIVSGSSPVQSLGILEMEVGTVGGLSPLPEKGKLLQAVMKAGPLLQTLLLAGPLPQWRHPPPPLDSLEIPPVSIPTTTAATPTGILQQDLCNTNNNGSSRKRDVGMCQESDESSSPLKFRRVLLH